jgi:Matrixin
MTASRRLVRPLLGLMLACAAIAPAGAYLKLGTMINGRTQTARWETMPIRYFVNDAGVPGVSPDEFRAAVSQGLSAWEAVASASIRFEFAGFTGAPPLDDDGISTMGFRARADLDRTLAATEFFVDTTTGEILESDVFFNSSFAWSAAPGGAANRYDVQSIATHEGGHFVGLGHSALGETELASGSRRLLAAGAVMFPIAFAAGDISGRTLRADDIAGVSDIYPNATFRNDTGSLQGKVTKNGQGVFGAHVIAFNLATGDLVAGFTLDSSGGFVVAGLVPGSYVVRVEPLDDGDVNGFFDGTTTVDTDFRAAFYETLVTISAGAGSSVINLTVSPK